MIGTVGVSYEYIERKREQLKEPCALRTNKLQLFVSCPRRLEGGVRK